MVIVVAERLAEKLEKILEEEATIVTDHTKFTAWFRRLKSRDGPWLLTNMAGPEYLQSHVVGKIEIKCWSDESRVVRKVVNHDSLNVRQWMDFIGWCNHQVVATEEIGQTFLQRGRQENLVVVLWVGDTRPIVKVLGQLETAFGVKIIYDADILTQCNLTASLSEEPLFDKIAIICETIQARYEIADGQIVIYAKGCK